MSRMQEAEEGIFSYLIGRRVKALYRDETKVKVARGFLVSVRGGFVRIDGRLGTIIINERNIERVSEGQ